MVNIEHPYFVSILILMCFKCSNIFHDSISLPCHPGVQVQSPERGSHCAPFKHGHSFPQSSPHLPGGQAEIEIVKLFDR